MAAFSNPGPTKAVKTMITVTMDVLCRIRSLGSTKGITTDSHVINFLLQHYDGTTSGKPLCAKCQKTLEAYCFSCSAGEAEKGLNLPASASARVRRKPARTGCGLTAAVSVKQTPDTNEISNGEHLSAERSGSDPESADNLTMKTTHSSARDSKQALLTAEDLIQLPVYFGAASQMSATRSEAGVSGGCAAVEMCTEEDAHFAKGAVATAPLAKLASISVNTGRDARLSSPAAIPKKRTKLLPARSRSAKVLAKLRKQAADAGYDASVIEEGEIVQSGAVRGSPEEEPSAADGKEDDRQLVKAHLIRKKERKKQEYHQQRGTPYRCTVCSASFSLWRGFQEHLFENLDARYSYRCRHCQATVRNYRDMKAHGHGHLTEMRYKCEHCGQTFPTKLNMRPHCLAHKKEGLHLCSICGKSFWILKNLQQHMRIHTGEKAFQCTWCGKRFTQNQHLIRHVRTHTGEKPYKCQHCPASFSQSDSLNRHLRQHTGEEAGVQCGPCGAYFANGMLLKRHARLMH